MSKRSDTPYRVKRLRYGEKVVRGRVIGPPSNEKIIPEDQVAQLAQYHCTNAEMAEFFGVSLQTFMDNFRDIIDKNRLLTKHRLRKAQLDLALKGDKTMLIWLGKNILGQSDNPMDAGDAQPLPWTTEPDDIED